MPKGIPLTEEEQARRRREIFDAAVYLFLEKGFNETSMREIAEAAGVGKSTLYDYFKTKDEILLSYFEGELDFMAETAQQISQTDLPAPQKLRQVLATHLDYLVANKKFYLRLSMEVQRLSLESQKHMQHSRHVYQDWVCQIIEMGIKEGSFRPVNPLMAVRIVFAALTPVVFTTRPTGTPHEMLDAALDILFHGIQA